MSLGFVFDRLLQPEDICNHDKEIEEIAKHIKNGECVRLYAPRNYGKTSILKNVVGSRWEQLSKKTRVMVYVDFYSVASMADISKELFLAVNRALSSRKNFVEKGGDWLKLLKKLRPAWKANSEGSIEFSLALDDGVDIPDFELILENIGALQNSGRFAFFLIFDEFQEIAHVSKAAAKLRGALQNLPSTLPVAVLGSKYHLFKEVFDTPKAPFFSWGFPISLEAIPYESYYAYMQERFGAIGKTIDFTAACYLQDKLNRIPESINRICEFMRTDQNIKKIDRMLIEDSLANYVDAAATLYHNLYSTLLPNERLFINEVAHQGIVAEITGRDFLLKTRLAKSSIKGVLNKLLDQGVIEQLSSEQRGFRYQLVDPLFSIFIKKFK